MVIKMIKPQNHCIYCGSPGLTKEHIWAEWLREYIPREMTEHHIARTVVRLDGEERIVERRTGDPHARRVRRVCKSCNSGWMSQIQTAVRPQLAPMLLGEPTEINRRGQTLIAAWVAMLAMIAEQIDPDKVAIPPEDRRWLMNRRQPPSHWRIWITHARRVSYPRINHHVVSLVNDRVEGWMSNPPPAPNAQTTTVCVGKHLVIHVMSSRIARHIVRRWKPPELVAGSMSQIWPPPGRLVRWPVGDALTDAGLTLVGDQFYDAVNRQVRRNAGLNN